LLYQGRDAIGACTWQMDSTMSREEPIAWNIREGVGLVLPLHGQLIDFQHLGGMQELDLEIAAAYLRVATNAVNKALEGRKVING
jgi:hypothetical protein